ncbi:MAG: EAL domain-containing protein [Gammaproteobacteria bacterium]|nr:MAG: EAL domain-containing protein [Gammaproteobacteria bacterium]
MRPLSLLPKYLLITALVCAAAVGIATLSLYLVFRASLETALNESSQIYHDRLLERTQNYARRTSTAIARRVVIPLQAGHTQDVEGVLARAMELNGAALIVVLDEAGATLAHAGDISLLPAIETAPAGTTVTGGRTIVSRTRIGEPAQALGSVGQVFDTMIAPAELGGFGSLLQEIRADYRRQSLLSGALIALLIVSAAVVILVVFAFRQVRAIRFLIGNAERLTGGSYDAAITLPRGDELGQLAHAFDQLRERLRTATISRDYLDRVLGSMNEALILTDAEGRITRVNLAASRLLELPETTLLDRPVTQIIATARREDFRLEDSASRTQESVLLGRDGTEIPVSYTISGIHDSNPGSRGFIIAARNIAERKMAEQRIRYLARIDALTKVPNRMQFQHLLQRSIARASRSGRRLALLYLDVDRFKDINDIYGHAGGDLCLETLTDRLRRLLPESTVVGRFAGDEFGIILDDLDEPGNDTQDLADRARKVLRELSQVIAFQGQQIHMTASIGIAVYPADANNVIDLVRSADSALYHAKRSGGGDTIEFFDPEMNAAATERLMLKSRLRRAYERDELLVHYQPKVDLRTGRVAGAEALVRWEMSERGIVLPSEFIPLAEESNLILDIGEWVLERVCHDFSQWQKKMLFPGKVSLNLSLKQLRQPNFSGRVADIFRKHGVPPASLELEITESTLMENPERTVRILDELYSMGLSLAIDDFGTGYSSLSALQKFPISTLKIDQSFVRDAATDADDATIVATIIQMGHGLNLDVIAEGVESHGQLRFLRSTGCDYVQGLLFGEPMSGAEFMRLLASQRQGAPPFKAMFG